MWIMSERTSGSGKLVSLVPALCLGFLVCLGPSACSENFQTRGHFEGDTVTCADGVDNDGNGQADCDDPACSGWASCGGVRPDGGPVSAGDSFVRPPRGWETCTTAKGESIATGGAVDIIWFIDTSGSMAKETEWVQQNLNDFAAYIGAQNLDYRVVLIGASSVCVAPPLGGANCTDGPNYRHVKQTVASTNGPEKIITTYPKWQDFLRAEATKNFVAVTDDNSARSAQWFNTELAKLSNPGFQDGFIFHSIVAFGDVPAKGCATGAEIGQVYLDLTTQTNGVKFPVCSEDWKPIFDQLARSVAASAKVPCSYSIPPAPAGKTFNLNLIEVYRTDPGKEGLIPRAANAASCGAEGWYYDDPSAPKTVLLCPQTCTDVAGGKIEIEFGCLGSIG